MKGVTNTADRVPVLAKNLIHAAVGLNDCLRRCGMIPQEHFTQIARQSALAYY
jgi:hypothetical protein